MRILPTFWTTASISSLYLNVSPDFSRTIEHPHNEIRCFTGWMKTYYNMLIMNSYHPTMQHTLSSSILEEFANTAQTHCNAWAMYCKSRKSCVESTVTWWSWCCVWCNKWLKCDRFEKRYNSIEIVLAYLLYSHSLPVIQTLCELVSKDCQCFRIELCRCIC